MEILSPVWPPSGAVRVPKTRPRRLDGATVALLDDNLDVAFTTRLEALLAERYGATVRRLVKPSGTAPAPPALIEAAAAGVAAAVVGVGL
ncbi:MAG TPA: hypothetical protein VNK50_04015 [Calidithermus sp.]|nr:hypothetical protein [Calidithermus sp.]